MQRLVEAINPNTLGGLMCRSMLSVDGERILDQCDFNQMPDRLVATGRHCLGCTAGSGFIYQRCVTGANTNVKEGE